MDGAFPRYSTSTPFIKSYPHMSDGYNGQVYHYRNSMEDPNLMKYMGSSNSSTTSSSTTTNSSRQSSYSPPTTSTPQRVHRKPVSNNPAVRSSPHNEWKTSSPKPISQTPQSLHQKNNVSAMKAKNYHAADTVHPNRIRTYSQVVHQYFL